MMRSFILLLVVGMLFSVSGCTMSEVLVVKQDEPLRFEPKLNLSAKENQILKSWVNAAAMADDLGDSTTAILYYTKISDYFPDTKEGKKAQSRLNDIGGKPKVAEEENSL